MSASTTFPGRMTADEFIDWAAHLPNGERYELCEGVRFRKTAERVLHGQTKIRFVVGISNAIRDAGLPCEVYTSEMAVKVHEDVVYEPDVVVRCGTPLDGDALHIVDPVIIVEVHSPSTSSIDTGRKLEDYIAIDSLRHYLIVNARLRRVVHHARLDNGPFQTTILGDGPIRLDPPGLVLSDLFPSA